MTTGASGLPSALFMQSIDLDLRHSYYRRFPKTREPYDKQREQEVVAITSKSKEWLRIGKPFFRRDAVTSVVFRRAPPSRLYPKGRITVCVPYELSFNVAALEHLKSHALVLRGVKPNSIDSTIAAKYTGVDRNQMRYIRNQCNKCNVNVGVSFQTSVDCPLMVHNLTRAHNALDAESFSSTTGESTGFRPERTDMDCNKIGNVDLSSDSRYSTLVWVGCGDKMTENLSTQIIQHRHTTAANSAHVPSCFLLPRAESLLRRLGSTFLSIDREHVTAHQSLVVASLLEDRAKCRVEYQTADQIKRQLIGRSSLSDSQTILMLAWRRYEVNLAAVMRDIYANVKKYESCVLRVFPSEEELEHAHGKIDDILALDEVAQHAPIGWSFRPVTCDCTSACRLGKAGVLKRTHSCGSEHVIVRPTASDVSKYLKCTADQRRTSKRKAAQSRERWFHQELVEGLRSVGEFRVFIVTVTDLAAMRGRRGEVVEVVHTIELEDRELVVTVLTSDLIWSAKPDPHVEINIQELKMFALYVFNALRSRPDWSAKFESLEIGARVDVGIAVSGVSCRYFVNEVTRIYEADFFAEWLAQPGTHVCRAVSTALEEVFVKLSGGGDIATL